MTQNSNILNELKELKSCLADTGSQNIYTVPSGYFEGLADEVLNRIKALEATTAADELVHLSPMLSAVGKQMPYTIPAGYFDGLEERILHAVLHHHDNVAEELNSLSPLLSGLKKDMPFEVPQGYFEKPGTAKQQTKTKVVSITKRSWLRYAGAAVVTGVIALTAFLLLNNKNNAAGSTLAKFEKKITKEIKSTSDQELSDFLEYTSSEQDVAYNAPKPKEEAKELLKDVSADELKQFLDETADPDVSVDEKTAME